MHSVFDAVTDIVILLHREPELKRGNVIKMTTFSPPCNANQSGGRLHPGTRGSLRPVKREVGTSKTDSGLSNKLGERLSTVWCDRERTHRQMPFASHEKPGCGAVQAAWEESSALLSAFGVRVGSSTCTISNSLKLRAGYVKERLPFCRRICVYRRTLLPGDAGYGSHQLHSE